MLTTSLAPSFCFAIFLCNQGTQLTRGLHEFILVDVSTVTR